MSFLSKMTDKFADMMSDKDKEKDKHGEGPGGMWSLSKTTCHAFSTNTSLPDEHSRGYGDHGSSGYPPQQHGASGDYYSGQQQHSYGGAPPPPHGPPGDSQLPPGWTKQWDPNAQRFYYIDPATGRSQWDPPASYGHGGPPPGPPGGGYGGYGSHYQSRGYEGGYGGHGTPGDGGHGAPGYGGGHGYPHYEEHRGHDGSMYKHEEKHGSGKGGMIAAGLGGAALGAVGGAVIAHEMSTSSTHILTGSIY